jgi:hypothetical protein
VKPSQPQGKGVLAFIFPQNLALLDGLKSRWRLSVFPK